MSKNCRMFANTECTLLPTNARPLCAWPRKKPTTARREPRTCVGTCHRDFVIYKWVCQVSHSAPTEAPLVVESLSLTPKTMPIGKMMPYASIWIRMWIQRILSCTSC
jgi:hypothetical protein